MEEAKTKALKAARGGQYIQRGDLREEEDSMPEQGSTAREGIYRQRRKLQTEKDPVSWRKIYK